MHQILTDLRHSGSQYRHSIRTYQYCYRRPSIFHDIRIVFCCKYVRFVLGRIYSENVDFNVYDKKQQILKKGGVVSMNVFTHKRTCSYLNVHICCLRPNLYVLFNNMSYFFVPKCLNILSSFLKKKQPIWGLIHCLVCGFVSKSRCLSTTCS